MAGAGELHVSPKGDDAGAGTATAPLRTLPAAATRARAAGGARIVLADGTYETAEPFVLTAADSVRSGAAAVPAPASSPFGDT